MDAAGAMAAPTATVAANAAGESQAHTENLATSSTITKMLGVSAQNCCVSAARKRDMTSPTAKKNAVMTVGLTDNSAVAKEEVIETDDESAVGSTVGCEAFTTLEGGSGE